MKKLSVLFVAFLFVFTSCSSDDDNGNQIDLSVDITGQWDLTGIELEGDASMTFEGQTVTITYTGFGKDFDAEVIFTDNPKEVNATGTYTMVMTTSFLGFSETEEYPVDFSDDFDAGTWSIEGNLLVITDANTNEVQTAQIVHLTQNKMILVMEEVESMDGMSATIIGEITLER